MFSIRGFLCSGLSLSFRHLDLKLSRQIIRRLNVFRDIIIFLTAGSDCAVVDYMFSDDGFLLMLPYRSHL